MDLRTWRSRQNLTLDEAAKRLGLLGAGRPRAFQRIEIGESPVDADLAAAILAMTDGKVTFRDLHATRLTWLKAHDRVRPAFRGASA